MNTRMLKQIARTRAAALCAAVICAALVGACGSSGAGSAGAGAGTSASDVLTQTFTGSHDIQSGVLHFSLTVTPTGSSTITGPLSLTVDGPFQSLGSGELPELDLTATVNALGQTGSLGVISTATGAYLTLDGSSYQVPAAALAHLHAAIIHARASARVHARTGMLSKLGIHPLSWLINPTIVSTSASVAGTQTTEVQAGVDVEKLVKQLYSAILSRVPRHYGMPAVAPAIPAGLLAQLATVHPTVSVFSGNTDHTLRQLVLDVSVPVSGSLQSQLGGLTNVHVVLTLALSDLNQPQTITAPSNPAPFSLFEAKLRSILSGLGPLLGSSSLGSLLGSSSAGRGAAGASKVERYGRCVAAAGSDAAELQKCTKLLNK
jgi:hypothetical protein